MSRIKIKNGKPDMNRQLYKDIKRFDRETMNDFLQDIYEEGVKKGYESGLQDGCKALSEDMISLARMEIMKDVKGLKGIGEKKALEIENIVKKHLEEMMQHDEKCSD